MTIFTTDQELNILQHTVNEAREGKIFVTVKMDALKHLLRDHYALHTELRRQRGVIPEVTNG